MALLLGVDTGGTYTDAVILDDAQSGEGAVIASAKALTTHGDLATGVGEAVAQVFAASGAAPSDIALASLSTTLATNALVEGRGERAALIAIGFAEVDLTRAGLTEALKDDPLITIDGGHGPDGNARAPLDLTALRAELPRLEGVAGVAVAGYFSVRNPAHEREVRDVIRAETGLPCTCSFEISPKVGGPKRALTTLLNARLIGLIDRLIRSAEDRLAELGVKAPLMVVRGDGALVAADFARRKPIETILSGPAASIVGAGFLTEQKDAIVSDIGGTTTDIAILSGGRPKLDPDGAQVGGMRTMVEAVAMATHGLGGDSDVMVEADGLGARLTLGPQRALPLSLLALEHPQIKETLAARLDQPRHEMTDLRFLTHHAGPATARDQDEAAVLEAVVAGPLPEKDIPNARKGRAAAARLLGRGAIRRAGFTPSDAAHVLGLTDAWDAEASRLGAQVLRQVRRGDGGAFAETEEDLAQAVIDRLARLSSEAVLDSALAEDGIGGGASSALAQAALNGASGVLRPALGFTVPLIGLGASAPTYYPMVAELLGAAPLTPRHAGVANAVGAVAGRVVIRREVTITTPIDGVFRAHLSAPKDFTDQQTAEDAAEAEMRDALLTAAEQAGADTPTLRLHWRRNEAEVEGRKVLVDATLSGEASGRPRLAT